ncbi:hypothetical protein [Pseudoxanthomonas winnipegensis]|uniref:Uncharacterized protein n=1 Tax=Pseudoxanthomonas winnipegensis TaxID=2480810 RepID=A0A4V2HFX4_9GAMM|nr:hypothetical protein [Pseudoxanthomonas winnipegensis]TAA41526.1 hypothetical protein EA655_11330 [Pseudoxanthomonas winnipegensis]
MSTHKPEEIIEMIDQDQAYRDEKAMNAAGSDNAKLWVEADLKAETLERRINQYDREIERRLDGTNLLEMEQDLEKAITVRDEFLANNPRPTMFQPRARKEWGDEYDKFDTAITTLHQDMQKWEEEADPKQIAALQERRQAKFEEFQQTITQRQSYGRLPSERPMIEEVASYDSAMMGQDAFSLLDRIAIRREQQDRNNGRVGSISYGAETALQMDEEDKVLGKIQSDLVRDLGRWPKEHEVIAAEKKYHEQQNPQAPVQVQTLELKKDHIQ